MQRQLCVYMTLAESKSQTARAKGLNEGQWNRRGKSKPSESYSEHEIQACKPQDSVLFEDAVISSILSLTKIYEQSWHFIHKEQVKCYGKYLKFCSVNRIIYRTVAMTNLSSLALLEDLEKRTTLQMIKTAWSHAKIEQGSNVMVKNISPQVKRKSLWKYRKTRSRILTGHLVEQVQLLVKALI